MPLVIDEKTAKEITVLRRIAEDAMALMGDAIQLAAAVLAVRDGHPAPGRRWE